MINKETYTLEWIENISKKNRKADKILIEKVIRALTLLVELKKANLDFIFKGGTALMLMLSKAYRLSIDIDIILPPETKNLNTILSDIIQNSNFLRYEVHKRDTQSDIEKAHYKFFYNSIHKTHSSEEYILLDILFEQNPYNNIIETEVNSDFLKLNDDLITVKTPTFNNILGDKMTAFAPNTTGIPYFKGEHSMSMEIIKQLFDIGNLFDVHTDIQEVRNVFTKMANIELNYRSMNSLNSDDVLEDMFKTALCISLRGQDEDCNFEELQKGIKRIKSYIISELFHIDKAILTSSKVAYLSAIIMTEQNTCDKFTDISQIIDKKITNNDFNKFNKFKKTNPEAFFYWFKALELRNEL